MTDKSCAVGAQTLTSLTGEKKKAVESKQGIYIQTSCLLWDNDPLTGIQSSNKKE